MAKKTGKKPKDSGKSEPAKSGRAREKSPSSKPSADRKADTACQFCGRAMKDARTLKIHERSCGSKPKAAETEKKIETELLEIKDRFEDEKENLMKTFQEREDHLQRELEEVKTVLRLEIDRHRKELERISKVEKEVAEAKQEPEGKPPAQQETESPAKAQEPPAPVQKAPEPVRNSHPVAVDITPVRVHAVPRRSLPEDAIPDLDSDPEPQPKPQAVDLAAVEAMVRDIVQQVLPADKPVQGADEISGKLAQLSSKLDSLDSRLDQSVSGLRKQFDRVDRDAELKKIDKELEKLSEKVQDIMEDSGFGESLSVSKIPPTILEIVYQAIMDDVIIEIMRAKGPQDAERVARSALEEVRLKTSGSELFRFDGRKIVTDNLAKSIEANMISAKQIQTTYDVLMEKLLETVPHHKAKNFKGMIKVKSQEFAVDRATKLTKEFARLENNLESLNQMVAAMSASVNSQILSVHERLAGIAEKDIPAKAGLEDLNALRAKLEDADERFISIGNEIALLRAELEMKSGIQEREENVSGDVFLAPGEEPSEPDVPEGGVFSTVQEMPDDKPEDCTAPVLEAVSRGLDSKAAIARETGLDRDEVAKALSELAEAKKIIGKKAGKRVRYTTLALELERVKDASENEPTPQSPGVIVLDDAEPAPETPEPVPDIPSEQPAEPVPAAEPEPAEQTKHSGPGIIVLDDSPDEPERKSPPKSRKKQKRMLDEPKEESHEDASAPEPPGAEPAGEEEKAPEPPVEPEPAREEEKPPEPAKKKKQGKTRAPEPPAKPAEQAQPDDLPKVMKAVSELSEEEAKVLDAISEAGVTLSGIQSKVGKGMKRFVLLRALRVLIDSGHVGITAKGRMELYQRITVQQMDETDNRKNRKEVK